jgi:hypothetical protein
MSIGHDLFVDPMTCFFLKIRFCRVGGCIIEGLDKPISHRIPIVYAIYGNMDPINIPQSC